MASSTAQLDISLDENALRAEYRDHIATLGVYRVRASAALGCVLYPVFVALDLVAHREAALYLFKVRLVVSVVCGAILWITYLPKAKSISNLLFSFTICVAAFGIEAMLIHLGAATTPYYAGLCLVLLASMLFPWTFRQTLAFCSFVFLVYLIPALLVVDASSLPTLVNNLGFLCATAVILATNAYYGERKRWMDFVLQHQLAVSLEKAREFDKLKTQFFANISHELRTPLTLMLSPMEELLDNSQYALNSGAHTLIELMLRNGKRLLRLINGLLDLSKLEAGKLQLQLGLHSLPKLLEEAGAQFRAYAISRNISLRVEASAAAPDFVFDLERMELVLQNLLSNALKFTPEGGTVWVRLREEPGAQSIEVEDSGIGIEPQKQAQIFNRFAQADGSITRRYGGTGIGLSLTKELMELHGGSVNLQSTLGKGSCFTARLPQLTLDPILQEGSRDSAPFAPNSRDVLVDWVEGTPSGPVTQAETAGATILVIDDHPDLRTLLTAILSPDYCVLTARDGEEGLARAQEILPDLVISDVMMPGKSGYEVARELKASPSTVHIPVILLTAKLDNQSLLRGLDIGADDYLRKPFAPSELLARVRSQLRIRELTMMFIRSSGQSMIADLASGVAHEVNNPLAILTMSAEEMSDIAAEAEDEGVRSRLLDLSTVVQSTLDRIVGIVSGLKCLAFHEKSRTLEVFAAKRLLDDVALLSKAKAYEVGASLEVKVTPENLTLEGSGSELRHAVLSIARNAIEAVEKAERRLVRMEAYRSEDGIFIEVRDTGGGVPKEIEQRIFQPFFTTKAVGNGVGMGLATAQSIIGNHHGEIKLLQQDGMTCFSIRLPKLEV